MSRAPTLNRFTRIGVIVITLLEHLSEYSIGVKCRRMNVMKIHETLPRTPEAHAVSDRPRVLKQIPNHALLASLIFGTVTSFRKPPSQMLLPRSPVWPKELRVRRKPLLPFLPAQLRVRSPEHSFQRCSLDLYPRKCGCESTTTSQQCGFDGHGPGVYLVSADYAAQVCTTQLS